MSFPFANFVPKASLKFVLIYKIVLSFCACGHQCMFIWWPHCCLTFDFARDIVEGLIILIVKILLTIRALAGTCICVRFYFVFVNFNKFSHWNCCFTF